MKILKMPFLVLTFSALMINACSNQPSDYQKQLVESEHRAQNPHSDQSDAKKPFCLSKRSSFESQLGMALPFAVVAGAMLSHSRNGVSDAPERQLTPDASPKADSNCL